MMGGPPPGFRNPGDATEKLKPPKPQSVREVPDYLKKLLGGFFSRLLYIFRLVWDAKPWILFAMIFMAVFNGVRPVIDAKIASLLLTSLGDAAVSLVNGVTYDFSHIMHYLLFQFLILHRYHN